VSDAVKKLWELSDALFRSGNQWDGARSVIREVICEIANHETEIERLRVDASERRNETVAMCSQLERDRDEAREAARIIRSDTTAQYDPSGLWRRYSRRWPWLEEGGEG
jgi:hypothetical protein